MVSNLLRLSLGSVATACAYLVFQLSISTNAQGRLHEKYVQTSAQMGMKVDASSFYASLPSTPDRHSIQLSFAELCLWITLSLT
jgi:hypothetical protein